MCTADLYWKVPGYTCLNMASTNQNTGGKREMMERFAVFTITIVFHEGYDKNLSSTIKGSKLLVQTYILFKSFFFIPYNPL